MLRIVLGVIAGFLMWAVAWFGVEMILSAISPEFGAHQQAFQSAIESRGQFNAVSSFLAVHIVLAAVVSAVAGFLSAVTAGENKRAPLVLGFILLAVGLMKAAMSWALVPIWYHLIFTGLLLPAAIIGGKLYGKR
jgi:hypothetical protein